MYILYVIFSRKDKNAFTITLTYTHTYVHLHSPTHTHPILGHPTTLQPAHRDATSTTGV